MKKFVQIYKNKAHWIFEAEEKPEFHPSIIILDITGDNEIQEGWDYDETTNTFSAPYVPDPVPIPETPTLEEMQTQTLLNTEYLVVMSEIENV
ncbi:hypothetical protein HYI36_18625 [Bacillus sp. Gen3]|nr:hypothetical protein [Bacillus sp. Gen3]